MSTGQDLTQPSGWGDRAWICPRCEVRTGLLICLRCDRHLVTRPRRKTSEGPVNP
jgi:hypothetical protein